MEPEITSTITWTFLDNLREGVLLVSTDGTVQYANPAVLLLFGLEQVPSTLTDLFQNVHAVGNWAGLLYPPTETRLAIQDGRMLLVESKAIADYDGSLIQLNFSSPPSPPQVELEPLSALTKINKEPDFETKLQLIADGLYSIGWNRVLISLRDEDLQPTQLVMAGFPEDERARLKTKILPADSWHDLLKKPEIDSFRSGDCYFIPGDSSWSQENLGKGRVESPSSLGDDPGAWHPQDRLFVPLTDQQEQIIGLVSLDKPVNGRRPDRNAFQIIELYAQFAISILENQLLTQETEIRKREFNSLFEANQSISGALDKKTVISLMGKHMRQATQADGFTIYQWHANSNQLAVLKDFADVDHFDGGPPETLPEGTRLPLNSGSPLSTVITSQEPLLFSSTQDVPIQPHPIWLPKDNYFEAIIIPLTISEEVFGLIVLFARGRERTFKSRDLQLLTTLSNQASSVLETVLIFEDTYERERFYNALGRVSLAINYTLDHTTLLGLICQESLRIFNVDGAYLWQIENSQFTGSTAKGQGELSFAESIVPLSDSEAFVSLIYNRRQAMYLNHVNHVHLRLPQKETIQAVLGVPLEQEGEIIGVMVLVDRQNPDRFSDKDINQAITFGVQVTIALQNAKLFEELRRFNEELDLRVAERTHALNEESSRVKILLRISSELAASLDQDRVLNQALNLVNEVVNATHGTILLINQETDELVFRASLGMKQPGSPREKPSGIMRHEGLAGWMITNRSAVIVHDTREDSRWIDLPNSRDYLSVLGVPLITNDEVIGVMMLFHTETAAFTMQQLDLVEAAAIQVANAINNANLYLLIRDQAERLGSMLRTEQIEAAKNQAILESIADGVLVANDTGHIVLANMPASTILDIPRDQLLGKSINELLGLYGHAGDSWIKTIEEWATNADRSKQWDFLSDQLEIEEKIVSIHLSPVLAGRQYFGTVSIFRDITKEVEVDNLKSEFVSTVSHELRTPMTSIKGYADLMLMGATGNMSPAQARYMTVIKNNADRLHMLVNDLLDISRIETNKTVLDLRPIDVAQLVEEVVEGHLQGRIQHVQKQLQIKTEMAPSLPLVQADSARITQVLTNLLDNAFNYTLEGGKINISAHQDGDYVKISVKDNGIGISENNIEKIFERFFRAESSDVQNIPGTGLGLSIVNSLIDMHGGELKVESKLGQGSTFSFTLPIIDKDGDPA